MNSLMSVIDQIASVHMDYVFNPWLESDDLDVEPANAPGRRRERLAKHFDCQPEFLLIGEAPGYQGCHFSGVPFTNEALLIEGVIPRIQVEGRLTTRELPWREPAATVMWRQLYELKIEQRVVMWNGFAWHPFKQGNIHSNRAPMAHELKNGLHVLRAVIDHFKGARVIACGNVAEWTLLKLGVKIDGKVRHPSMGGATQFRKQLAALCGKAAT